MRLGDLKPISPKLKIFAENVRYAPEKHRRAFKLRPSSEKKDIVVECQI